MASNVNKQYINAKPIESNTYKNYIKDITKTVTRLKFDALRGRV